ncbi:uncharacterized protein LOC123540846 isoform X1 [Mercenaria mercenaria]|uniref:uncharacterized protein LOC123540846 isoform X1 n=1 Tax=Mercenaria mercenaria TaxID=6596 RepID=UPI00234EC4B1|nr:uncharacterized protein LOC123540846 isoform X1 [Mercenaria mercenaria]
MKDIFIVKMAGKTKVEKFEIKDQKMHSAWSDDSDKNVTSLKQILKLMLYGLAIAGNYSFSDINSAGENSSSIKSVLSKIYRTYVFISILIMVIKFIAGFFYLPTDYFYFSILCAVWSTYILCIQLYSMKATSSKYGHYEKVFKIWDQKIMPEFKELGIEYPSFKLRKGVIIVLVIAFILVVCNTAGLGVQIYISGGYFYTAPFESNPYTLTAYFILVTAEILAWIIPVAFVISLTKLIQEAFNSLNKYKSKLCEQNGCKMVENFQKIRMLHLNLSKLVSDLDEDLGWFYAIIFTFNIGLSVFTLYQIIKRTLTTFELVLYVFWFLCGLASIGLPAIHAALVNDAAHAPLDSIYYINVQDITVEKLAQLNLFLSKLTGTQVGFSTCGLLIITKEFILTIAGVFLTYFAVLYTL